jgi:hypothetical protein
MSFCTKHHRRLIQRLSGGGRPVHLILQGESARVLWMAWAGVLVMEKGFLPLFFYLGEKKSEL